MERSAGLNLLGLDAKAPPDFRGEVTSECAAGNRRAVAGVNLSTFALWDQTPEMTALFTLLPEAVDTIEADSKQSILERLAGRFSEVYGLDSTLVLERVEEREKLGSTGFGRGVAIPHARMPDLARPVAVFLRLKSPVAFDSADGMPVHLVFGLLSPEQAGAAHLHALAAISRMMRDERMHEALEEAPNGEALYALLANVIDRDAA
jgi:PTS system nitrogen regulatory IIA component